MSRRPNILLITTDEERAAVPRPDGFRLPALERLADGGVTFERYYVASVMCSSSRSVIYTGRHVPVTQVYDNDNMPWVRPLDPALGTLGTMLRRLGYHCAYQGKWHLSNLHQQKPAWSESTRDALEPYGFSDWNDWGDLDGGAWAGLQVDPVIAGGAARWLRDRAPVVAEEQPWFLAVNFVNPHDIMSFDYGSRSKIRMPLGLDHAVAVRPPAPIPLYQRQWDVDLPASVHDDLSGAPPAVREYKAALDVSFGAVQGDEPWRAGMSFYLNCLRDVDRCVGLVLDALVASGQDDGTVVIFTSDHGDLVGSHGLRQKGPVVYDENFHVPLVIRHPDGPAGATSGALASAVDLAPTLLAFAGLDDAAIATEFPDLHGHSLVPALHGAPVREGVLTAVESITTLDASFWLAFGEPDVMDKVGSGELRPDFTNRGFLRGYTDERYSFGRYFSPLAPSRPADAQQAASENDLVLYDRLEDPHELVNVAADPAYADVLAECVGKLEALITAEIGDDRHAWVAERPRLLGWSARDLGAPAPPMA